ncbi:START domain-containing protein [Marinobacter sp.]|uniref:START domain-containing protein n=1 Tax=Marinobacter sp. TaxID=50741 RepID=UPI002B26E05D|nr:START domain-containing protein [Marinobacter sp.]
MRHFSFSTLAFLSLTLFSVSPALASEWVVNQQGEKRSDVTTYVRDTESSPIKQFRGVVETEHSMFSAMSVINDISLCQQWVYNCQDARYHYAEDDEKLLWMMFDGVWPASDRDLVMESSFTQEDVNGPVTVQSIGRPDAAPKQPDYVRIPMLNNSFYIEPLADGWTRITFTTQVDPGGLVPAWIANIVATDAPIRTLEGLQKMMDKEPFKHYSKENLPTKLIEKHHLRFSTLGS